MSKSGNTLNVDAAQTQITSVGTLTSLKIADGATIGSASDASAITIAASGACIFSDTIIGDLTGDITGDVTGNADTATNLSGSQTAKYVYAAPNANNGTASFRALVASDIPTLNQNTSR